MRCFGRQRTGISTLQGLLGRAGNVRRFGLIERCPGGSRSLNGEVSRVVIQVYGGLFDVGIKPIEHFVDELFVRFQGGIPMWFMGQHDQFGNTAIAADCLVELAGLEWFGARVGVIFAMDQE